MAELTGTRVALTGAGGFIGARVASALVGAGARVTVLARSRHDDGALGRMGVERVAHADLASSGAALAGALEGADVLCHFAYDVRASGDDNLAAFDRLLSAAQKAGVRRIVHASSVVVYDDWPVGPLSEAAPWGGPGGGGYRQAKIAMERRLLEGPLEAAMLQPTLVYGPGSALWTEGPLQALRRGPVVLPSPSGICPLVYVDDVARAAVLAAGLPDLGRERFLLNGDDGATWDALYDGYARLLGGAEIRHVPAEDLAARFGPIQPASASSGPSAAARISAVLRRLVGRRRFEAAIRLARDLTQRGKPTWPDRGLFGLMTASPRIDCGQARMRLGWQPETNLDAGLAAIRQQLR